MVYLFYLVNGIVRPSTITNIIRNGIIFGHFVVDVTDLKVFSEIPSTHTKVGMIEVIAMSRENALTSIPCAQESVQRMAVEVV